MRINARYLKRKYRYKNGPAPIFHTINEYFFSPGWHEIWDKFKKDNPVLIFVIRKPSGMVERVLIKEAKQGIEFDLFQNPAKEPKFDANVKPAPNEDEKIKDELQQISENGSVQTDLSPSPKPDLTEMEDVDIQPGIMMMAKIDERPTKCEVVAVYDEQEQLVVKIDETKQLVTIFQEDILTLVR